MNRHIAFPGLKPRFGLIGHRGVPSLAPENTLPSFKLAAEHGLNWIEFDTMPCKSGEWVVIHDETLDRTTNGQGLVAESTYQTLQKLDAGSWYGPQFKHTPLPNLSNVLKFAHTLELLTNIEIKIEPDIILDNKHISSLIKILEKSKLPYYPAPLISSFNLNFLKRFKQLAPQYPIGYLIEHFSNEALLASERYNFSTLHCAHERMEPEKLIDATKKNIGICLYTVNEPELAAYWLKKGAMALFTDMPYNLTPNLPF